MPWQRRGYTVQSCSGIECQSLQFVFAGIDMYRADESAHAAYVVAYILVVCNSTGQDDPLDLPAEYGRHGTDLLSDTVTHCIENQSCMFVARFDTFYDLLYGVCSEVCNQTSATAEQFPQLLVGIFFGLNQPHPGTGRQSSGPFGREGAFAVEGIVHVDDLALLVRPDRNAAAQVCHDEVYILVSLVDQIGI